MKNKKTYKVIGVMSGTSLDGIDLAYVNFKKSNTWEFQLGASKTISYNRYWETKLSEIKEGEKIEETNQEYGGFLGHLIKKFIIENKLKVDFICSHGHTVFHQPQNKYTLQIGSGQEIANYTQKITICDFRQKDINLDGQGAPLVPIGDSLLFNKYDYCLNLGGFSNISYSEKTIRKAFDICPVNIVLNELSRMIGHPFDKNGEIARNGKLDLNLLHKLNSIIYYKKEPPKSLGKEWVTETITPILKKYNNTPSVLRTFTEHIAMQIGEVMKKGQCLVSGGGVYNTFLIEKIKKYSKSNIYIPNKKIIDFKEALIFGFLGVLRYRNEINCLRSVTGAKRDSSTGVIFQPY